jgi:DNA-binding GntR family transcriptional regulator
MSGQLRAGEIIQPPAIGEAIGVSATPVREALQTLRVEGFVELVPRRGFQVASITGKDIRDMFIAYALIAGELAARAAQVASEDQLNELEALHYELMAAARRGDISVVEAKNVAFHGEINRIANAPKTVWILGFIERYIPASFYSSIEGWPEATVEDHSKILAAVVKGDAEAARRSMQEHLVRAGELLAKQFETRTESVAGAG